MPAFSPHAYPECVCSRNAVRCCIPHHTMLIPHHTMLHTTPYNAAYHTIQCCIPHHTLLHTTPYNTAYHTIQCCIPHHTMLHTTPYTQSWACSTLTMAHSTKHALECHTTHRSCAEPCAGPHFYLMYRHSLCDALCRATPRQRERCCLS